MADSDPTKDRDTQSAEPVGNSGEAGSSKEPVLDPNPQEETQDQSHGKPPKHEAPVMFSDAISHPDPPAAVDADVEFIQAGAHPDLLSATTAQNSRTSVLEQEKGSGHDSLAGKDPGQDIGVSGEESGPAPNIEPSQTSRSEKPISSELLLAAAKDGNLDEVKRLIDADADMETKDSDGDTALHLAVRNFHGDVVKFLLGKFPNLLGIKGFDDHTPLELAIRAPGDSTEVLGSILKKTEEDISLLEQIPDGEMSLHQAISDWKIKRAIALAESLYGRRLVDITDSIGQTALHKACFAGYDEVVKVLLKMGSSLNAQDEDGDTPLHCQWILQRMAIYANADRVVEVLVDHESIKEVVNIRGTFDRTAIFMCIELRRKDWVQTLINLGAKLELEDIFGSTVLGLACLYGSAEMAELLIESGADMEQTDRDGWNALHTMVGEDMQQMTELLLDKGANINTSTGDNDGETALHIALRSDHTDIVRILLRRGADTTKKTNEGKSAWDLAVESDDDDHRIIRMELLKGLDDGERTAGIAQLAAWTTWATFGPLLKSVNWKGHSDLKEKLTLTCLATDSNQKSHSILCSILRKKVELPAVESEKNKIEGVKSEVAAGSKAAQSKAIENEATERKKWTALEWAAYLGLPDVVMWQLKTRPPVRTTLKRATTMVNNILAEREEGQTMKTSTPQASTKDYQKTRDWLENPPFIQLQQNEKPSFKVPPNERVQCTEKFYTTITDFYQKDQKSETNGKFELLSRVCTVEKVVYQTTKISKSESTEATKMPKSIPQSTSGKKVVKPKMQESTKEKQRLDPTGSQGIMQRALEDLNRLRGVEKRMAPLPGTEAQEDYTEKDLRFRWIHLPANNLQWMLDVTTRVYRDKDNSEQSTEESIPDFFQKSWRELHGSKSEVRYMRPTCVKETVPPRVKNSGSSDRKDNTVPTDAAAKQVTAKDGEDGEGHDKTPLHNAADEDGEPAQEEQELKAITPYHRIALYMPYITFSIHWPHRGKMKATDAVERDTLLSQIYRTDQKASRNTTKPINEDIPINPETASKHTGIPIEDSEFDQEDEDTFEDPDMNDNQHSGAVLHKTRTLDEFYYGSLSDTQYRDKTQVVTKYIDGRPREQNEDGRAQPEENVGDGRIKMLRVDQIWLWVIDNETIITSSTNRIDDEEDPLIEGIHEYLGEVKGSSRKRLPLPTSVDDMAKFITTFCIEFMQRSTTNVMGKSLTAKQIFANTINEAADEETRLFEAFKRKIEAKLKRLESERNTGKASEKHNASESWLSLRNLFNSVRKQNVIEQGKESTEQAKEVAEQEKEVIDQEKGMTDQEKEYRSIKRATRLLVDVKDIRDELNILRYLLTQQEEVWERLHDVHDSSRAHDRQDDRADDQNYRKQSEKWKSPMELRKDIDEMITSAITIQDGVKSILELEQNDASISEAEQARRLSEVTIEQGKTLMAFTIVTILFLPLSFLTSLFALNVSVFPHKGDELYYSPGYIFPLIFTIAAVTFLAIAGCAFPGWFSRRFRKWIPSDSTGANRADGGKRGNKSGERQDDEKRNGKSQSDGKQKDEAENARPKNEMGGRRGVLRLPMLGMTHRKSQKKDEEKDLGGLGDRADGGDSKVPRSTVRGKDSDK